jgi:hypothetical protein
MAAYDKDAFHAGAGGHLQDPSIFIEIDQLDWKKVQGCFKLLCGDYETCFQNWKKSGFHDDFPDKELKPFSAFTKGQMIMLYTHGWLQQFPDMLSPLVSKHFVLSVLYRVDCF